MSDEKATSRSQSVSDRFIDQTRQLLRQSLDILRRSPPPDTFVGRKTQEPFRRENDEN